MNRKDWLLTSLPFFVTWLVDRLTKEWANDLTTQYSFQFIHFILHHNPGAMLGLFSDLPKVLRVVSLSTGGAFLLCTYFLIQYLLPIKSTTLRAGLSILIGGIIGNVTDRIQWGFVVDFIVIGTPSLASPAFNLADLLQWVGYFMVIYAILKEKDLLWPQFDTRKATWVNVRFQVKYSLILVAIGLSLTMISLVFSYTYLRVTVSELAGYNQYIIDKFIVPYTITYVVICLSFCAILFAIGRIFSHRIAGPLYAFERYLHDALRGKENLAELKLRAGDDFKHLEELSKKVADELHKIRKDRTVNVVEFDEKAKPTETE